MIYSDFYNYMVVNTHIRLYKLVLNSLDSILEFIGILNQVSLSGTFPTKTNVDDTTINLKHVKNLR